MQFEPQCIAERLEHILSSGPFVQSARMRRFLSYVVATTVAGEPEVLKETVIGVEVFDRQPGYDPKIDPIVRNEARRLRDKLAEYYRTEGQSADIRIELPKGAYVPRFIPRESEPEPKAAMPAAPIAEAPDQAAVQAAKPWTARRTMGLTAGLLLAALAVTSWYRMTAREQSSSAPVNFTDYPGDEISPSFSPDGSQIAFAWHSPSSPSFDIYVKPIDGTEEQRLTSDPAQEYSPRWSPDGRSIAFLRGEWGQPASVMIISPDTKAQRKLADLRAHAWRAQSIEWSPDGKWLIVPDWEDPAEPEGLFALSIETGQKRRLTLPPADLLDYQPALSPDGSRLVFVRQAGGAATELLLLQLDKDLAPAGQPSRITAPAGAMNLHPNWLPGGQEILFVSSFQSERRGAWRVAVPRGDVFGKPEPVSSIERGAYYLTLSRGSHPMAAYARDNSAGSFWRTDVSGEGREVRPRKLLSSNTPDLSPSFSPDGKNFVFASMRSQTDEIWGAAADGSHLVRWTFLGGPHTGSPSWSPDGSSILFDSAEAGVPQIFRIRSAGAAPERITVDRSNHVLPSWSHDGKWIYYASDTGGRSQISKTPAMGGAPVQVTQHGGFCAAESPDGKWLYYTLTHGEDAPLFRVSTQGGSETQILPSVHRRVFAVGSNGIYFHAAARVDSQYCIRYLNFRDGQIREVVCADKPFNYGMALSPDEHSLIYSQIDQAGLDLRLVRSVR